MFLLGPPVDCWWKKYRKCSEYYSTKFFFQFIIDNSPDSNRWRRLSHGAVGCSDNPLWMNQSSSTERKTRGCSYLCLPRPSSFRGLCTTDNTCTGFVPTSPWSSISTSSSATTATSALAAPTDFTTLLTVFLHEVLVLSLAISTSSPGRAGTPFVFATWKNKTTEVRQRLAPWNG